jgi:uncharacterized protein
MVPLSPFRTDIFTVPFKDGYILYIPALALVAGVDVRVKELVDSIHCGEPLLSTPFNDSWIEALSALGVFSPPVSSDDRSGGHKEFRPTDVTLSLTSRCQLRCIYCYARGGENVTDMDPELIHAAIRLVAKNALELGGKEFVIGFHGEGEATANWSLFQEAVTFAKDLAQRSDLEAKFKLTSNCIWSRAQRVFISKYFRDISVSLDGLPEIQNYQRPTANGSPSFQIVFENLRFLEQVGVEYSLRPTVLPQGVEQMLPFLEFVAANLKCNWIHYEPVELSGRAISGVEYVEPAAHYEKFVNTFHKAVVRGNELGIHIDYSGCRALQQRENFCGVTGPDPTFFVSSRGYVSSCYEISDPASKKGAFTVYGEYNRLRHEFSFDPDKLNRIRTTSVKDFHHCGECFAKWNCAGDCLARSDVIFDAEGSLVGSQESPRCAANRKTTLSALARYALADSVYHDRG